MYPVNGSNQGNYPPIEKGEKPPSYKRCHEYPLGDPEFVPLGVDVKPPPYVMFSPVYKQIEALAQSKCQDDFGRFLDGVCCGDAGDGKALKSVKDTPVQELERQHSLFIQEVMDLVCFTRIGNKYSTKLIYMSDQSSLVSRHSFNSYRQKRENYFCGVDSRQISIYRAYVLIRMYLHNFRKHENVTENLPVRVSHEGQFGFYPARGVQVFQLYNELPQQSSGEQEDSSQKTGSWVMSQIC